MKKNNSKITLSLVVSLSLSNLLYAKDAIDLNTLTVTAQKSEEKVQEVPISMSVFDEHLIDDKNIDSVLDLANHTSGFIVFNAGDGGTLSPSIRGLYSDPAMTTSTTVSMYIDGIPTQSTLGYDAILENIERIEILKGPQGTLYGKNAEAGVINIITKKPNNETRGKIGLEAGSDNKKQISFNVSGAIIKDKFFASLSGRYYEKDGFMTNTYLNNDHNNKKNSFGKLYLRYLPSDDLELSLISSIAKRDDGSLTLNTMNATNIKQVAIDADSFNKLQSQSHAFKIDYNFDEYTISSITAYKKDRDYRLVDMDFSPLKYYHSLMDMDYKTLSQEFKLNAKTDNLKWLVGLYGDKSEADGGPTVFSIDPRTAGSGLQQKTDDNSFGVFAHGEYAINNKISILSGLRYDKDEKKLSDKTTSVKLDKSFSEISPKLSLKYAIDTNIMTYATISKGYRSGGFYMFAPVGMQSFDKETLWNYELGFKSSLLDNKLIFNGSIYYMDLSDMQVLTNISPSQGYISNAATATSKGLELEANYKINDEVSVFSSLAYNQTKFDEFRDAFGDYNGKYAPFAPKFNYSIGLKYRALSGLYGSVDLNGYDKMYIDKANSFKQDAYELVDAKIGYEFENYDIYVYGKNIFDKNYDTKGYYGAYTYLSTPSEFGVQLNYRF